MQREVLRLPEGTDPLQTYENGRPLGETRFLDFGTGIAATLIGDDYVRITGLTALSAEYDAIVDSTIPATDTGLVPPVFKTSPGEALTYLSSIGLTRANVFVRPGTYTETANVTPPASVFLYGAPGGSEALVTWNRGANLTMSATSWHIENISIGLSSMTTLNTPFGTPSRFYAVNCLFSFTNTAGGSVALGNTTSGASFCYFKDCSFDGIRRLGAIAEVIGGDYRTRGESGLLIATDLLVTRDLSVAGSSSCSWTLPTNSSIHLIGARNVSRAGSNSGGGVLSLNKTSGSSDFQFIENAGVGTYVAVNLAGSTTTFVKIKGGFSAIATSSASGGAIIDATVNAAGGVGADIVGPAVIDIYLLSCRAILRGLSVNGSLSGDSPPGGSPFVSFVNADHCNIQASSDAGGALSSPYSFDAASINNLLLFHGISVFPSVGTDAGTNNRVLPEGATAFTTNGHVVEDEGTPLTQRANLNFVGAGVTVTDASPDTVVTIPATSTIDGHVVEDEGTPLTQRANLNFVGAGVTVTDSAPDTIVTIPGGGSSSFASIDKWLTD